MQRIFFAIYINYFFVNNTRFKKQLNMKTNWFYFMLSLCVTAVYSENQDYSYEEDPVEYNQNSSFILHNKRIMNGETIDISQAKYYVFVTYDVGHTALNICGGTLIRRNKVITAAHCVENCTASELKIAVGLNALSELSEARKYRTSSIQIHPKYIKYNRGDPYDVAVVTLSQNVELNNKIGTINYANSIPPLQSYLRVVGHGAINKNLESPTRLQSAQLRIIRYKGTQIFTVVQGPSVMKGDSGGPAIYNHQLVGVTSAIGENIPWIPVYKCNIFVAVGNSEILSFIRKYAP